MPYINERSRIVPTVNVHFLLHCVCFLLVACVCKPFQKAIYTNIEVSLHLKFMVLRIESIETTDYRLCTVLNYDRGPVSRKCIAKLNCNRYRVRSFAIDTSMGIETYQKLVKDCINLKPLNGSFLEQRDLHFFKN